MRAEEKVVDGPELEREEEKESLEQEDVEELPALVDEEVVDRELEHREALLSATRRIFACETIIVDTLQLPARELRALEFLQAAVEGRDRDFAKFVYAEDRRDMLEQALAVLEPILEHGDDAVVRDLGDLRTHVGELRERLLDLEDAQDELLVEDVGEVKAETESGDKPGDQLAEDARLDGPERPQAPRRPSTLLGPELAPKPAAPTTLVGPDAPPKQATPSTLVGSDAAAKPDAPSTLAGPEPPREPERPTTLGDAEDIAKAQATPWWRRVFG